MPFRKVFALLIIGGLIAVPIGLLLLPASYFDSGRVLCPSVLLLNRTCLGCGLTRAGMYFLHANFEQAWFYNKLIFVVMPLVAYLGYKILKKNVEYLKK